MKKFLIVLLCLIGGMTLIMGGAILVFWVLGSTGGATVSSRTVLKVNLEVSFLEDLPDDPVGSYMLRGAPLVREFVQALERAGSDDRVEGLVARIGAGGHGMAVTQELRDAILRFRESGKFAVAYSETFGDNGPGNGGYYLATAFDEIWLQPSGDLGLTGLRLEFPFVRGTFDLLGIKPQLDQRYEYKNAMNMYTHTEFTEPHEEAMQKLLESWFGQLARGVAEERGMTEEEVRALADDGPYYGQEAVDHGLVDHLGYRDQVYDAVEERISGSVQYTYLDTYLERAGSPYRSGPTIALIYGNGNVVRGRSQYAAFSGEVAMGSDTVATAFRAAVKDPRVEAIVFRVNSPGGSYPASDTIYREVQRAREAGKPVIVTMGNYAASGGYFVSIDADRIIAQPGTLTGSIGVLGGKIVSRDLYKKIGMTFDEVHTSKNSGTYSGLQEYSEDEWERFQGWLDRVYEDFTGKVAGGRELPLEEVLEIAKGRVWTGEQALAVGLVDELGGMSRAVEVAKEVAGIDASRSVRLTVFPLKRTPLQMFLDFDSGFSGSKAATEAMAQTLQQVQPYGHLASQSLGGPARHGVLSMPPLFGVEP